MGRKLFDGKNVDLVLQKCEEVWGIGGSDVEAAFYADISSSALYAFLKDNPDISARKEKLKNKPILKARKKVDSGISEDHEFALKYLERKLPDEFALKNRTEILNINFVVDMVGKVGEILNKFLPNKCPHCKKMLEVKEPIVLELQNMSKQLDFAKPAQ